MYKIKHNLSESCLKDLFSGVNGNYKLRSQSDFRVPGINKVFPNDLRNICDFDLFKMIIQIWKPVDCLC